MYSTCYIPIGMRVLPIMNARHAARSIKHMKHFQGNPQATPGMHMRMRVR